MQSRLLFLLVSALLAPFAASANAEVGQHVRWEDVRLHDGKVLPASALNGKTVVVEFWATWCPFCKKQNPYVQKLHADHAGKDFVVLGISIDKSPDLVTEYTKKYGYTFPTTMAGPQSERWFPNRRGLPVVYVVDRKGQIVFREAGEMFEEDILGLVRFAQTGARQGVK